MKSESPLTALLIAPNRELAELFLEAASVARVFAVLHELKTYPTEQAVDIRLRQLRPEVVLVDLSADLEAAIALIRLIHALQPEVRIVGLHLRNSADAVLRSLRNGAKEFLHAPFDAATQEHAAERLRRLRKPEPQVERELGKVYSFASAKKGSGASTLAAQTALAIQSQYNKRVILLDFDFAGGSTAFYLKISPEASMLDAVQGEGPLDAGFWGALVASAGGLDVIAAPEEPYAGPVDPDRLHEVIGYARSLYDCVVIDLPTIFHRISLMTLPESDKIYVVSTPELPSLHLTRKAVNLLRQIGLSKDRYFVVVNRSQKGDGIGSGEMEKIFTCSIHAELPNDPFSVNRVVTLGEPLEEDSELGKAIGGLATQMTGIAPGATKRRPPRALAPIPLFHES